VTLVGLSVQVSPVEGDDTKPRPTVPVNPLMGAIVIVEVAEDPALAFALVGFAVTLKSWTVTATAAVWTSAPLVPVTVTVYTPALPEQVRVDVCETPRMTLVGLSVQEAPVLGETELVSETVPENPFTGATVIVEVALAPAGALTTVGLAATA
jgi:hypothetical protein